MVETGALGVVGAGAMGSEIALLGAAAGDHATLVDTDPGALATGLQLGAGREAGPPSGPAMGIPEPETGKGP
ncbi:MAG: 3-hydroxyacyl-CoA dehydrogenase NAD-binding domain-containing protein [Thermoleophilia bacterium]|nr:3-hydroxyacyl-CoA dehydrogenase NAD-binding domain-containing protein [Thermoleophilia bacterium]MDH3725533.1 3-hydroxyacyl-CoA dehydrogenase NAD-binding domain-containing protein [Thermoleophilia bacterium]